MNRENVLIQGCSDIRALLRGIALEKRIKRLACFYYMEDFQANSEANINMLMDAYEAYGFMVTSQEQVIGNMG